MYEDSNFDTEQAERLFHDAYEKHMQGRVDEAIKLYQQSLEKCPTAEAHTFLGWAYSFSGRFEDAIEECKKAIEIDPEFGNPYNDIGCYLMSLKRSSESIPWFKKAKTAERLPLCSRMG